MEEIYKRIRDRREEIGMSQEALAKKVGYATRSTIARIEKGEIDLPQSKLVEIAEALKVTPSYLLGWSDKEKSTQYYIDREVGEIAQELHSRSELQILFDASRNLSKEDIEAVTLIVEKMANK